MQDHKKVAMQITSLVKKIEDIEVLLGVRDALIATCRDNDIEVLAAEECPPQDPDCLPPKNPPPGP